MTSLVAERGKAQRAPADHETSWFSDLYEQTFDSAYRYACLLTRDPDLAEDLVSDVYLRVWVNRCHLIESSRATGWILTVVRNRVTDEFRSRKVTVDLDHVPEQIHIDTHEIERELTPAQKEFIHQAIHRLTAEQQRVVFLRFFQQMPHEQIARELGRTANAVRAIQFRALARMRKLMESELVG